MKIKNNKGVTLIEVLAVTVVLSVLMLIAVVSVHSIIKKAKTDAFEKSVNIILKTAKQQIDETGVIDESKLLKELDFDDSEYEIKLEDLNGSYLISINSKEKTFVNADLKSFASKYNDKYYFKEDSLYTTINNSGNVKSPISEDGTPVITVNYDVGSVIDVKRNDGSGKKESFYVLSDDGDNLTLLAKYNLMVGKKIDIVKNLEEEITEDTYEDFGWQSKDTTFSIGEDGPNETIYYGSVNFAEPDESHADSSNEYLGYWTDSDGNLKEEYGSSYPAYVYDENSTLYNYVESYVKKLKNSLKIDNINGRLIKHDDLSKYCSYSEYEDMDVCEPNFIFRDVFYWSGFVTSERYPAFVALDGMIAAYGGDMDFWTESFFGLRPVIEVPKDKFIAVANPVINKLLK